MKGIKLNIAQKLTLGFGAILLLIITNGIWTFSTLTTSKNLNKKLTAVYSPSAEKLNQLATMVTDSKMLIRSWVFIDKQSGTPDKVRLDSLQNIDYPILKEDIKSLYPEWSAEHIQSTDSIFTDIERLFESEKYVMKSLSTFESYEDAMVLFDVEPQVQEGGVIITLVDNISLRIDKLSNQYLEISDKTLTKASSSFSILQWVIIIMSIIILVVAIAAAYFLYISIVSPLNKGVKFAQAIGEGDLSATVEVNQDDEIGELVKALVSMADNIKETVVSIQKNSNELVDSSGHLKDSSLQLSKGSADQAASAEEVSTSIEQMVANIDQNTENSIQTEKITVETAKDVAVADRLTSEAAKAMKTVSEKITIISDIAFQTNILALNAAVEAARAGEQGRGFSVVAAEVRKLAERSKAAAEEIVSLVKTGLKVSQEAGDKAKALVPDIEKTTQLIKEISAASMEQKTGAEQINMAMQRLNHITQENASSSDALTQSSDSLANLAENLKSSVSYFSLGEVEKLEVMQEEEETKEIETPIIDLGIEDEEVEDEKPNLENNSEKPTFGMKDKSFDTPNKKPDNPFTNFDKDFDMDNYEKF